MQVKAEFQISSLADKPMREAIGAICVHWSLLELMVERVIATLEGNPRTVRYTSDLAHRLHDLKAAAKKHLCPEKRNRISEIAGFIKKVGKERHRVAHGLWALDASGNFMSIFPRDESGHVGKPMDTKEMRKIKLLIWQAHEALKPFADLGQSVELSSRHRPSKQVPPRPVLPPAQKAKKNTRMTQPET